MREALEQVGREARRARPTRRGRRAARPLARSGSRIASPTRSRGSTDWRGAWKTSCTRWRSARGARTPQALDAPAVDRHRRRRRAPAAARGPARACSCPTRSGRRARAARPGASVSEARSQRAHAAEGLRDRVSAEHGRSTGRARRRRRGRGRAAESEQRSKRSGQRSANAQCDGSAVSSGGRPGIARPSRSGSARSSSRPYGCDGRVEERRGRADLDDPARVQQREPAAEPLGQAQVVRDHEQRRSARGDLEQLLGGGVDERGVQPGGRLVGDHELRLADQRQRVDDALLHAARELVDVAAAQLVEVQVELGRAARAAAPEPRCSLSPRARAASTSCPPRRRTGFSDDAGRLRDQRDPPPARRRAARAATRAAARRRRSRTDPLTVGVARQQPQQRVREHGLAAPALAHHQQQLAGRDAQPRVRQRLHDAARRAEPDREVLDLQADS